MERGNDFACCEDLDLEIAVRDFRHILRKRQRAAEGGARAVYQLSGVTPFGQGAGIRLCGSEGALDYDLVNDRIRGASRRRGNPPGPAGAMGEIAIPDDKAGGWRVEADFVDAIREGKPIEFTDFASGVRYMEFTEAVWKSAASGQAVDIAHL